MQTEFPGKEIVPVASCPVTMCPCEESTSIFSITAF